MADKSELAKRMKEYYENISKTKLIRRCPVAIRLDGKAFHTFTRGFKKPFDEILIKTMQDTMKYLCENIQGCVLGYTQSDEITLILIDYQKLNSSAWFDYKVQKMCSISASMATMAFNKFFSENIDKYVFEHEDIRNWIGEVVEAGDLDKEYYKNLLNAKEKGAMFDARCFNIPKEEVANLLYWRQWDASKNSIQMVGQANFSQKRLEGKSTNKIQDMLMTEKGINWNDYPIYQKRGSCCIKEYYQNEEVDIKDGVSLRSKWVIDKEIPIFKGEDRNYIERFVYLTEEE